jgi:Putative auto-transporter adhesin, head GIN domain
MKNLWIVVLFAISVLSTQAQETQTRSLGTFTGVKVAEGIDVYLKKGDKESAKVETIGTKLENVITEVSGSYLKIEMREGTWGVKGKVNVKVYVTYVNIDKLSVSSGGNIFADAAIKAKSLDIHASSAGAIEAVVDATKTSASASSGGQIDLQGKATQFEADASSGGQVNAYDLESDHVDAQASSGGSLKVNAKESLNAQASSGGSVRYHGNPNKQMTNSSSGGSVKKSN